MRTDLSSMQADSPTSIVDHAVGGYHLNLSPPCLRIHRRILCRAKLVAPNNIDSRRYGKIVAVAVCSFCCCLLLLLLLTPSAYCCFLLLLQQRQQQQRHQRQQPRSRLPRALQGNRGCVGRAINRTVYPSHAHRNMPTTTITSHTSQQSPPLLGASVPVIGLKLGLKSVYQLTNTATF